MLVPNKNPKGHKEHVIFIIDFALGEGITIIDLISNMKLYVSDIEESYKDKIIGHMVNSSTTDSLLHIV